MRARKNPQCIAADTPAVFLRSHLRPSPKPRISRYEAIFPQSVKLGEVLIELAKQGMLGCRQLALRVLLQLIFELFGFHALTSSSVTRERVKAVTESF